MVFQAFLARDLILSFLKKVIVPLTSLPAQEKLRSVRMPAYYQKNTCFCGRFRLHAHSRNLCEKIGPGWGYTH